MAQIKTPPERAPSLFRLAFPLIISFWMRSLFTFVDTFYASFLGDEAIAAISLSIPLEFAMIAIWVGISTGLTSHLSKALAKGSTAAFDQLVRTSYKILAVVIPSFMCLGIGIYFYAPHMNLDPEVGRGFAIYGSVLIVGSAFSSFWSVIPDSIVKAHHDTRSTMIAGILSNVCNLILNTVFTFVFHWGLFGIALSTGIGRFAGLVYALHRAHTLEKERRKNLSSPEDSLLENPLKKIFDLAVPSSLAFLLMASENGIINFLISRTTDSAINTASLGAYGIFYRISHLALMPIVATTVAFLPFAARYAQKDLSMVHRSFIDSIKGGVLYAILFTGPVLYLGAGYIMEALTRSPLMIESGIFAIHMIPFFCLAWVPYHMSRPIFEGFQKGKPTVVMALLRYFILSIPLCILGREWGPLIHLTSFQGLLFGLLSATALSSMIFWIWAEAFFKKIAKDFSQG